jgi:hypothetical protein
MVDDQGNIVDDGIVKTVVLSVFFFVSPFRGPDIHDYIFFCFLFFPVRSGRRCSTEWKTL